MIQSLGDFFNPEIRIQESELIQRHNEQQSQLSHCPHCGCRHIVRNGTYQRKPSHINENDEVVTERITIQKYKCKECKKPFNDIPIFLTDVMHFTVLTILLIVLWADSNRAISKRFDIARSTVRAYRIITVSDLNRLRVLVEKYRPECLETVLRKFKFSFSRKLFSLSTT